MYREIRIENTLTDERGARCVSRKELMLSLFGVTIGESGSFLIFAQRDSNQSRQSQTLQRGVRCSSADVGHNDQLKNVDS